MASESVPPVSPESPAPPVKPVQKKHKVHFPWGGVILIGLGVIFLLQQFNYELNNWWALFILIPVFASLTSAWSEFRNKGNRLTHAVLSNIGSALVLLTLVTIFMIPLSWDRWWPLMVIVPGFSMFLGALPVADDADHPRLRRWADWGIWVSVAVMLVGAGFLVQYLMDISLTETLGFRWYSLPILLGGMGGVISAFAMRHHNENRFNLQSKMLLIIGLIILAVGGFILSPLEWNAMSAVIIIAAGVIILLTAWIK